MIKSALVRMGAGVLLASVPAVFAIGPLGCSGSNQSGRPPQHPNALLIILDTTRADVLSCYGEGQARTPAIDELAAGGLLFTEAVAQNPYTLGSVATILSSLPPDLHGIKGHGGFVLDDAATTLAEEFHASGYTTAAFVSAFPVRSETGLDQGFDVYDDDFSMTYPVFDAQYLPLAEGRVGAERRGNVTVDRALRWLRERRPEDAPFFLMIHLFDPHQPYDPPPPFQQAYLSKPYAGEVAYSDSLVGAVVRALDQEGLRRATVITVVGDHGEAFREHEEVGHGFLLYNTTLHVPWIMSGPGVPRARASGPTALMNVAPTLLAACGLEAPEAFQGSNRLEDVGTGGDVQLPPAAFYIETYYPRVTHRWSELIGWRDGEWKYIRGPRPELFDLAGDPNEHENVLEQQTERTATLSTALDEYLSRDTPHRLTSVVQAADEQTLERLRSLGYVGSASSDDDDAAAGWDLGLPDPKDRVAEWNRGQSARAFYRLGLTHFHAGDFQEALRWADNAVQADSTHLDAMLLQCQSLTSLGRHSEAVSRLGALLAKRPEDTTAWTYLGISLFELGEIERAEVAYRSALEVDESSPEANFNLGSLLARTDRFEEAVPFYEKVRQLEPENAPLRADLARIYLETGRRDKALEVLEEAHSIDPKHPSTLLLLGQMRIEDGRVDEGKSLLKSFLDLYPNRPEVRDVRAFLQRVNRGG